MPSKNSSRDCFKLEAEAFAELPPRVNEKLAEKRIDLSALAELKGEEVEQALRDLLVNVDGPEGKKVHVFCE